MTETARPPARRIARVGDIDGVKMHFGLDLHRLWIPADPDAWVLGDETSAGVHPGSRDDCDHCPKLKPSGLLGWRRRRLWLLRAYGVRAAIRNDANAYRVFRREDAGMSENKIDVDEIRRRVAHIDKIRDDDA